MRQTANSTVIAVALVLGTIGALVQFVGGGPIEYWFALRWSYAILMALLARQVVQLRSATGLPQLLPFGFLAVQLLQELTLVFLFRSASLNILWETVHACVSSLDLVLLVTLIRVAAMGSSEERDVRSERIVKDEEASAVLQSSEGRLKSDASAGSAELKTDMVSQVVSHLYSRRDTAAATGRLSMAAMFLLVAIGGGASIGLWMSGHVQRLRSLEVERARVLRLTASLEELEKEAQSPEATQFFARRAEKIADDIGDIYGAGRNYESLLREIEQQSQTSWPDIAIRVTIAVLTLVLVQIFFSVYKYSSHHSAVLSSKAEALQLIGDDDDARKLLRRGVVKIVAEPSPPFAGAAKGPIEEAGEILSKLRELRSTE